MPAVTTGGHGYSELVPPRKLIILLAFLAAAILVRPLFFLAAPGILFLSLPMQRQGDPGERLGFALAGSTAFWIVIFWFLKLLGLPYASFAWSFSIGAALLAIWIAIRGALLDSRRDNAGETNGAEIRSADKWVWVALLVAAAARFLPVLTQLSPSGADMSMHTYVAALIQRHKGIPDSFEPLLAIEGLADYAPGFHSLMALALKPGGTDLLTAGLFVSCWTYALLGFAVYAFARRFAGSVPALIGTLLVVFGAPQPQDMFASGTNPSVMALALALCAAAALLQLPSGMRWGEILLAALLLASVPLTHAIPAVILLYCAIPIGIVALIRGSATQRNAILRDGLTVTVATLALLVPYLMHLQLQTSEVEILWTRSWQEKIWSGRFSELPLFLIARGGKIVLGLSGLAGLWVLWRRPKGLAIPLALAVWLGLLILNARFWLLPLSYGLYPDRLFQAMTAVMAIFVALAFEDLLRHARWVGIAGLAVAVLVGARGIQQHYYALGAAEQALLEEDLQAFEWIKENVPQDAIFLNNYEDAGLWLPAMTLRRAIVLHTVPFFMEEIRAFQEQARPSHIYVGAGSPARSNPEFDRSPFDADPDRYPLLSEWTGSDSPGSAVFAATDPEQLRAWYLSQPWVVAFRARWEEMTRPR